MNNIVRFYIKNHAERHGNQDCTASTKGAMIDGFSVQVDAMDGSFIVRENVDVLEELGGHYFYLI